MTISITQLSKYQFNQTGVPLAGGKLFTYAAGTTTKVPTYTDSTGGTPNSNPIILDSNGQCDLWVTAGTLYKFTLSPATDTDPPTNPFWVEDNQSSPGSSGSYTGPITGAPLTMNTGRVLGRTTVGVGAIEELTVGAGLSLAAGVLSASSSTTVPKYAAFTATTGQTLFTPLLFPYTLGIHELNVFQNGVHLAATDFSETSTSSFTLAVGATAGDIVEALVFPGQAIPGTIWRDGAGVPFNSLGINGDYYLNDTTGDVYLKTTGTYSIVANIHGTNGVTPVITGTSITSTLIATGSNVFATQSGISWNTGDWVIIASAANTSNYMSGNITAYSGTSLTVNVVAIGGSGTYADWNISLSGVKGADGAGTVSSVSVTTANGVSGTVATPTTTPAITLTLGAITPSAIQVSGLTASQAVVTDASKNLASLGYSTTSTASNLVERDANANIFINNSFARSSVIVSAGGTTVLTVASSRNNALTGTLAQTFQLPDATTLPLGPLFTFNNNSSSALTITNAGTSTLYTVPAGGVVQCGPTDISTVNGAWDFRPSAPQTVTWGSGVTGLVFNTALTTSPAISAGISSASNPSFVPQRGSLTTGYGGDSTHLYGSISGSAAFTATASTFAVAGTLASNSTGVINVTAAKTLAVSNTLTLAGTDSTTITFQGTDTYVGRATTDTLTNKNVKPRLLSAASYTTDTGTSLNCDNLDLFIVTAQAGALKFNNPTGTPYDGQCLWLAVTGTAARALTWDTQYEASTVALPTTTVTTARLDIGFMWRADTSKWHCVGVV